jgi:outer membrane protein assembly factor BamE (lipoprotein component of BamABCDE complex)
MFSKGGDMQRELRAFFALCGFVVLAGCAGTDFKRPDSSQVVLGKTSVDEVIRMMGEPRTTGEALRNNERIRTLTYAFAQAGGTPKYPGVTPARAMSFSSFEGVIVSHDFISSFAEDATDFDDAKISEIIKGKSTRADVLALLGKPCGEALYPVIKERQNTAVIYAYTQVKGSPFNLQVYRKILIVSLDPSGVVADVDFSTSGQR